MAQSSLHAGVIVFPGSNCDYDCYRAVRDIMGCNVSYVWHKDTNPGEFDAFIIPGGFSYGDYLRCGAIARFSPVMNAVVEHAKAGKHVLGICNGFQILCEAGLLPGALYMNTSLEFICSYVYINACRSDTDFTSQCAEKTVLNIPIAHGEGNYFADDETLKELEGEGRVLFRYCNHEGDVSDAYNPNGSRNNIAGIMNAQGNVLGMMPHPERAIHSRLGSRDGRYILHSLQNALQK